MSDLFNIRSFVGNQVEKLSSPKNILVDKFRQTVDQIKLPFSTTATTATITNNNERGDDLTINDAPLNLRPSESSSNSSVSSNEQTSQSLPISCKSIVHSNQSAPPHSQRISSLLSTSSPLSSPKLLSNFKTLTDRLSRRPSILRRHVSESNQIDETIITTNDDKSLSQPIYQNNPSTDINLSSNTNHDFNTITDVTTKLLGRSRSLIRQSTDTTCTFPIRNTMRRMESIETVEIPGLNGVKAIRYLNGNLGKLQPDLYMKQTSQSDPTYGCGKLTFTLFYNQQLTSLVVTILSIDNLPYRDSNTKILPDPYIKVILLPDRRRKFQTKVSKRTQSPHFNETFQFQITYEELRRRILLLSVYDFGRSTKRKLIGTVKVDDVLAMSDITSNDVTCIRSIVPGTESDPDLGELTLSLCYLPNAKRVTVTIVKASALKPMDITGKSDPYVKVILLIHGKKIRKKKTSVQPNTLNPTYNESLEFDVSIESLEDADLIFKVIDYDRVGANELIGCVGIGAHFDGINYDHWFQMLEHPRVPITESYNLRETIPIITCSSPRTTHKIITSNNV
ncbi:unnamed protein product [Rotaria sp. Silwood2]|nr:unnamed protein product [Rotaria sp. Silwood2]CAF2742157.1 unnamed protein product [Rotaria sp. Silwood2]CAF4327730.1 unnamed protein product [Rotaria sp. Silwood2]CAF4414135.1 unnamed protein product [Rotaria sp. Silwood2]